MGKSENFWKKEFIILVGGRNICDLNPETEIFEQDRVFVHKKFAPKNAFSQNINGIYDIAVAKLKGKSEKTFICLPSWWDKLPKSATIMGYGLREESEVNRTCELMEANIDILSNEKCSKAKNIFTFMKNDNFCAKSDKTDTCKGDSGGPLEVGYLLIRRGNY